MESPRSGGSMWMMASTAVLHFFSLGALLPPRALAPWPQGSWWAVGFLWQTLPCVSASSGTTPLTVLLTPACLAGAKPTAFPKGQCGCRTSCPLSMASVSQRPWEPALQSPLTLTRSLCQ